MRTLSPCAAMAAASTPSLAISLERAVCFCHDWLALRQRPRSLAQVEILLYHAQAWRLALAGCPLVGDDFEAWAEGPACPSLRMFFLNQPPARALETPWTRSALNALPGERRGGQGEAATAPLALLERVLEAFSQLDAQRLRSIARQGEPWLVARGGLGSARRGPVIDERLMARWALGELSAAR